MIWPKTKPIRFNSLYDIGDLGLEQSRKLENWWINRMYPNPRLHPLQVGFHAFAEKPATAKNDSGALTVDGFVCVMPADPGRINSQLMTNFSILRMIRSSTLESEARANKDVREKTKCKSAPSKDSN